MIRLKNGNTLMEGGFRMVDGDDINAIIDAFNKLEMIVNDMPKTSVFLNPKDFGAVGDGVVDDTVSLQAFFDYCTANNVGTADVTGDYLVSAPIVYGRLATPQTKNFIGRFHILTLTAMGSLFTIQGWVNGFFQYMVLTGVGSTSYVGRTVAVGFQSLDNQRCTFLKIFATAFSFAGLWAHISGGGDGNLVNYGDLKTVNCGTGSHIAKASLQCNWSNPVRVGGSGDISQSTTLSVDRLPPADVLAGTYGAVGDMPLLVQIGGRFYYINSVDSAVGTISVSPWLATSDVPGLATYCWGGGAYFRGNNQNTDRFSTLDATTCGIGLCATSLYAPLGTNLQTENCGVGLVFGRNPSGSCLGGRIDGFYTEANEADIVWIAEGSDTSTYSVVGSVYELDIGKCYMVAQPRNTDDSWSANFAQPAGRLTYRGRNYGAEKLPYNAANADSTPSIVINRPDQFYPLFRDAATISVAPLDLDINRLTGIDTVRIAVVGTGAGNKPSGAIAFTVPTGWALNGGAVTVNFETFTGPAQFVAQFDVPTMNLKVVQLS